MRLETVVPWGRTLSEYRRMFDLSDDDLRRAILGCGDGPASFNAEMTALGHSVISVDPLYAFSAADIRARIDATYDSVVEQTRTAAQRFVWRDFADADDLGRARLVAMQRFLLDFDAGLAAGRYRAESLPSLSFAGDAFDLALCSHLLFLYSDHLSLDFHLASLREMLRVAAEARVFPLLDLDGRPSRYVDPVRFALAEDGFDVDIQPVNYEFQVGGNQMMQVCRR